MIESFGDKDTAAVFSKKIVARFPPELTARAYRKLVQIDSAPNLAFLRVPPSNRLEPLRGKLKGFHSIRINDRWRIIFRFDRGNASDVKICDYH